MLEPAPGRGSVRGTNDGVTAPLIGQREVSSEQEETLPYDARRDGQVKSIAAASTVQGVKTIGALKDFR